MGFAIEPRQFGRISLVLTLLVTLVWISTTKAQSVPGNVASMCTGLHSQAARNQCLFTNSFLSVYGDAACKQRLHNRNNYLDCYYKVVRQLDDQYKRDHTWQRLHKQYDVSNRPFIAIAWMECHYSRGIDWNDQYGIDKCADQIIRVYQSDFTVNQSLRLHFAPPGRAAKKILPPAKPQEKKIEEQEDVCPSFPPNASRYPQVNCSQHGFDRCAPKNAYGSSTVIMPGRQGKDKNANNVCGCTRLADGLSCKWYTPD